MGSSPASKKKNSKSNMSMFSSSKSDEQESKSRSSSKDSKESKKKKRTKSEERKHRKQQHTPARASPKKKHSRRSKRNSARRHETDYDGKAKAINAPPITFCMVILEYLFMFLVGFFVGSACTMMIAVYLVHVTHSNCNSNQTADEDHEGQQGKHLDSFVGKDKCGNMFLVFIAVAGVVAIIYVGKKTICSSFWPDGKGQRPLSLTEPSEED